VNTVINLQVPSGGEFFDYLSDCFLFKKDSARGVSLVSLV
jgi:hypothetical protein